MVTFLSGPFRRISIIQIQLFGRNSKKSDSDIGKNALTYQILIYQADYKAFYNWHLFIVKPSNNAIHFCYIEQYNYGVPTKEINATIRGHEAVKGLDLLLIR